MVTGVKGTSAYISDGNRGFTETVIHGQYPFYDNRGRFLGNRTSVDLFDYNQDGILDYILSTTSIQGTNQGASDFKAEVFAGNGDGTFGTTAIATIPFHGPYKFADLNNDGYLDIATPQQLLSNGDGTYTEGPIIRASLFVGDINNDGFLDLTQNPSFDCYLNNGDGTFTYHANINTGNYIPGSYSNAALKDFDNDGILDFMTVDMFYKGLGNGDFQNAQVYNNMTITITTDSLTVADFNNDGLLDIFTGPHDTDGNLLGILRYQLPQIVDADGDGITDYQDNCTFVANPNQTDTDQDFIGDRCDGDFNNDGLVNFTDLGIFRGWMFSSGSEGDFNGDGVRNLQDLSFMRGFFFKPPGPSGLLDSMNQIPNPDPATATIVEGAGLITEVGNNFIVVGTTTLYYNASTITRFNGVTGFAIGLGVQYIGLQDPNSEILATVLEVN